MGNIKEYKPKTKVYGVVENTEKFDRMKFREETINKILNTNPKLVYKHFAHLIEIVDGNMFWDGAKVELLDDISLIFINNICTNSKD